MRTFAMLVLFGGLALLGFGIWQYYADRSEVRVDDAREIVDSSDVHPPIWVAGLFVLVGGFGMVATRNRRS